MAIIESGQVVDGIGVPLRVFPYRNSIPVNFVSDSASYAFSVVSNTLAAGQVSNAVFFMARNSATATRPIQITRFVLTWTTITAFTTPITGGRQLGLIRGTSTANPTGGLATAAAVPLNSTDPSSFFNSANGGDIRISDTTALTAVTGFTYEADPITVFPLTNLGNAGASRVFVLELDTLGSAPLILNASQFICLRNINTVAFDGGGTWQITVNVRYNELS